MTWHLIRVRCNIFISNVIIYNVDRIILIVITEELPCQRWTFTSLSDLWYNILDTEKQKTYIYPCLFTRAALHGNLSHWGVIFFQDMSV